MNILNICKNLNIDSDKVINIYYYGSIVYGTNNENSDKDFIIIYKDIKNTNEIKTTNFDATLYSIDEFKSKLLSHDVDVIESIYLPDELKNEKIKFDFKLNLSKLRQSFSSVSSNSFVKCKKKLLQNDNYIGKKSLFHSLRIIDYALQLSINNYINYKIPLYLKYDTYNDLWLEIDNYDTWEELRIKYKPIYNNLKSLFRKNCPI